MAASILFACGLNEKTLPSVVHISEESNVDGSFLISAILGQRLRISNAGTLLVCLQHNYQHYFNAGMRLGYNTNIFRGKTLSVIDSVSEIAFHGINSKWLLTADGTDQIANLLGNAIREQIATNFTQRISTTILVDNLGMLLNLGASEQDVLQLCHELTSLPQQYEQLTVITKLNNCDIYANADRNIAKLSNLRIRVRQLKSGVFREVDGKLVIERDAPIGEDECTYTCESTHKEVLYKVNERNVKIFNPGEIGVKV